MMKKTTRRRVLSALMALAMMLTMVPATPPVRAEETLSTDVTEPFVKDKKVTALVSDGSATTTFTSTSYRIPAMVTLADGTIVAAADVRWNTTYDGGGLDTLVARSSDGGVTWEYTLANYLGDNGNQYNGTDSTCFIDPSLTVAKDGKTVYMLCDLYPYGVALNGDKDTAPSTAAGFNDAGYLRLSNNDHYSYGYYLKDGKIYSTGGSEVSGYTVDGYFNLYQNGTKVSNLFYSDSPYKVVRTGFLYLTKSADGGKTWSEPTLLDLKTTSEQVCLVGPGRGITTKNGTMVFPVYSYYNGNEATSFVYSEDNGASWKRSASLTAIDSSEAAVVELKNGNLRFFFRNHTAYLCYADYNLTAGSWGSYVNTGVAINSNTQLSAITYSKTVDGKQVVLVSCPGGPNANGSSSSDGSCRINGRIFTGIVNDNGTMNWTEAINVTGTTTVSALSGSNYTDVQGFFAYSCLTERSDGSIAILYENNQYGWGAGDGKYYTITMKAYSASALGLSFDDGSGDELPDPVPDDPDAEYEITLTVGQSTTVSVSDTETLGTAGTFMSDDGKVKYVVSHYANTASYQKVTDGIESGKKYLLVCSSNYAVTTSSSSNNAWYTESLPLAQVNFNGSESAYFWTITETTGGYYIQNPSGQYMTIETGTGTKNYTVTLSSTPFVCDIVNSGNGYMIFANGTNIGLNNAGGDNKTALGWPADNNTVWTLYEYVQQGGTEVEITGLGVTSGTMIAVGDIVYTVIVEPLEVSETAFVMNGSQQTLDAVSDLGLSGSDYTVMYEETKDDSGVITLEGATVTAHESAMGTAIITATVKSGDYVIGIVTYTVKVAAVVVNDTKNIYVSVGHTVTVDGLVGEIVASMLDTSIATISPQEGTLAQQSVAFTGVKEGVTAIVVGDVQFNIYVNPANTIHRDQNDKYIYIYVDLMENCTVYYAINGGILNKIEGTGVLVGLGDNDDDYQLVTDGFNIMFFAVPDEGYALTTMGVSNSNGDYYCISDGDAADGSDSTAWPFDSATQSTVPQDSNHEDWKAGHGFRWALIQGNMSIEGMRDLFARALVLGADGATTITKNDAGERYSTHVSFVADRLPTVEKVILSYERDGESYNFAEDTVLRFGDIVTYQFIVTAYSKKVTYSEVVLSDDYIGFTQQIPASDLEVADDAEYTIRKYTATYEIKESDLHLYKDGHFVNEAVLSYKYKSEYDGGFQQSGASASVSCRISGIVYYVWADNVPEGIKNDSVNYPRPAYSVNNFGTDFVVSYYTGAPTMEERNEDGVAIGVWTFDHWEYDGEQYTGGETLTMPSASVGFVGVWVYTPYPTYTVTYQWSGAPAIGVTLPVDGGAYYAGQAYQVDATYKAGDTYTLDGVTYTFSGWKYNGSVVSGQQTMGQNDVTLVGQWRAEQNYTSLTIRKVGHDVIDAYQTFLFMVRGEGIELIVSVHGNSCVVIEGLKVNGEYTVTEITEWSWRYTYKTYTTTLASTEVENGATVILGDENNEIAFVNYRATNQWLDGDNWSDNIFDGQN